VPGLKLVFDTGNPIFTLDRSRPEPYPYQSAWEFYRQVRDHVAYVHIKDGKMDQAANKAVYGWPGEGDGDVRRICADLAKRGYDGGISIEPHMGAVFHDPSIKTDGAARFATYVEYGRRMERLLADVGATVSVP